MTAYTPPLADMRFALTLAGFESDITDAVLEEAAKLASEVIAPTNRDGDKFGAKLDATGNVTTAPGFKAAYQAPAGRGLVRRTV